MLRHVRDGPHRVDPLAAKFQRAEPCLHQVPGVEVHRCELARQVLHVNLASQGRDPRRYGGLVAEQARHLPQHVDHGPALLQHADLDARGCLPEVRGRQLHEVRAGPAAVPAHDLNVLEVQGHVPLVPRPPELEQRQWHELLSQPPNLARQGQHHHGEMALDDVPVLGPGPADCAGDVEADPLDPAVTQELQGGEHGVHLRV
mmetsp:Transcript_62393/g.201210  ORF Transcript_62393/g.201210 Transcript_62393/m.201210 type:complete len:202 (+) Transcript_62393:111-716(+)